MGILDVINISHSFGDKVLYKDSSFELFKGEHVGLVGQNGTGKTTLLNSLIGEVIPDKGEIRWQKNVGIGYLDQHAKISSDITIFDYLKKAFEELFKIENLLNKLYEEMSDNFDDQLFNKISDYQSVLQNKGFYEIDSTVLKISDGLGITALGMDKLMVELSGGQRAKVILAKLLLQNPDVLLLDEPTNFLDKEHVQWLTDFLKASTNTFIVISHNFDFLDKITNCICDIEFCSIKKYSGNFSKFIELKGLKREGYIRQFAAQQKKIKKFEDYISKNKARASTANMAKSRQKQLDRIDRIPPPESTPKPNFKFESLPISAQKTLIVKDLEVGYTHKILPKLNFEILSGQKIVITGFNGIGKSTLLKTLVKKIEPISGSFKFADTVKIGYFEQDLRWDNYKFTPVKIVNDAFPSLSERQVRKYLAQCGLRSKVVMQPVETLSGGEQAKVKICILMLTKCNLLILDEPTNHLDSDAKQKLKQQLLNWKGGLILVSHEQLFYQDISDTLINIEK